MEVLVEEAVSPIQETKFSRSLRSSTILRLPIPLVIIPRHAGQRGRETKPGLPRHKPPVPRIAVSAARIRGISQLSQLRPAYPGRYKNLSDATTLI
jgi:hypothetical protein